MGKKCPYTEKQIDAFRENVKELRSDNELTISLEGFWDQIQGPSETADRDAGYYLARIWQRSLSR